MKRMRSFLPPKDGTSLLGEAAAVLFASESLAYYLVGLFDRPHESVRMESAIAKYLCSEDIHEAITLLEQAFGPAGQTEQFLLEKARRDSRILTIYEGTNEVQRFLILKDLIGQAAHWPELAEQLAAEPDRLLAVWKNRLRKQVLEARGTAGRHLLVRCDASARALSTFGDGWQRSCGSSASTTGWNGSTARHTDLDRDMPDYGEKMLAAGQRAIVRTLARLEHLHRRSRLGWENIKDGMDTPEVKLADASLNAVSRKEAVSASRRGLRAALRILCIIRPVADLSPHPRIREGQLQELVWQIDPADAAALSQALELKANGPAGVIVDVLMPGGAWHDQLLRMAAGARADSLHRLPASTDASPAEYIQSIKDLEVMQQYQVIVTGAVCRNGEHGLGAYISGSLKRYHYRRERIEVKPDGSGLVHLALPAVVSITDAAGGPGLTMAESVEAQYVPVRIMRTGERIPAVASGFGLPFAAPSRSALVSAPSEAAAFLRAFAASASGGQAKDHIAELRTGPIDRGDAVWAVVESHDQRQNLAVLRACFRAAALTGRQVHAVVAAPGATWPRLLGAARLHGCSQAYCLDTGKGRLSKDGRRSLLRMMLNTSASAVVLAPLEWTSSLAFAAGEAGERILCCPAVSGMEKDGSNTIRFSLPCYDGRLLRQYTYQGGKALLSIASEADFPVAAQQQIFAARTLDIEINPDWIMPLPPASQPTLSQADVIIDLGYGIRDRAGLELARELKDGLERLGLAPLFGATRKVTQDLKLLPLDAQIGQTGVRVNPRLIIALGISGAPQHVDYLGTRAEVLCFNKDSEAPLMKLNRDRPSPRVHPILGDLFITVRELVDKLGS